MFSDVAKCCENTRHDRDFEKKIYLLTIVMKSKSPYKNITIFYAIMKTVQPLFNVYIEKDNISK
jgi:hypothetical protein